MSKEFNICLINDSFPPEIDGVANAVTNYANIITANHGKAVVVTPANARADDSVFKFPVLRYPSVDLTNLVGYHAGFPFSPEVQKKLVAEGFDLIHSHCPITSTMLARSLRDRIDVPIVMTYHTKFDIDIANAISSKLLQEEAKRLLAENISACDEVWTVSRGAGENLRSIGYKGDYIVMPNGVDFPRGRVDQALIREVTGSYDLPADVPVFLFVGRMMWYKGIRIILDALKLLSDAGADFRMVFVGGGGDRKEIVAYTEKLGLMERVFFVEPIHDRNCIRAWYCRADLFLFPSTFDTNGLVVREAAACALPSVLIRGSCAAEDVEDGVNGFLIEENAPSMAEMLRTLYTRMDLVKAVGEAALRDLYISWEEAVANACRRYEAVIENYRAGKYAKHTSLTDDLIHSIAKSMDGYNRSREFQKATMQALTDSYRRLYDQLMPEGQKRLTNQQDPQSRDDGPEAKEELYTAALMNKFDEMTRFLDRFM